MQSQIHSSQFLNADVFELWSKLCNNISDVALKKICVFYKTITSTRQKKVCTSQEMYYFKLDKVIPYCSFL